MPIEDSKAEPNSKIKCWCWRNYREYSSPEEARFPNDRLGVSTFLPRHTHLHLTVASSLLFSAIHSFSRSLPFDPIASIYTHAMWWKGRHLPIKVISRSPQPSLRRAKASWSYQFLQHWKRSRRRLYLKQKEENKGLGIHFQNITITKTIRTTSIRTVRSSARTERLAPGAYSDRETRFGF